MIDRNSQFMAILTNVGAAKLANATALGIPWNLTQLGVGDANGNDPMPSPTQTKLINERRRAPLNQVKVDPVNAAVIIAEQVIPADAGGWWVREIGVYDSDGDLVAVANCAPSYKAALDQGSGRTQVVRMNFVVSSTNNIVLKIDPAVVLATREYVDLRILEELYKLDSKQSVRVGTTTNIALAGLQTIDGIALVAGDRVLVKNQAVAKDNGLYIAAVGVWGRAPDADVSAEVTSALQVSVEQGTSLADTRWQLITDGVIVLGVTALTFQNVTQGFAPINSPALLGTPTGPTPPQFDNSTRLSTTASVKRMGVEYSGFAPLTASTALGASSVGGVVAAASVAPINITLPPTAGVPDGATVEVVNAGAAAVTVLPSGLDVLASPFAGAISVVLGAGDNAELVKVSGTWRLRGGAMALKYAAVMSGSNWTTRPQFESSQAFATTEFVKRVGVEWSGFSTVNANTVLGNGSVGGIVSATSFTAISITLPPTGAVGAGAMIMLVSGGVGAVTLLGSNGENTTNISGSAITVVLGQGDSAILSRVPGEWRLVGGSLALKYAYVMAAGSGANGYQKLPSGLQECRGSFTSSPTPGAPVNVTFPLGFGSINQLVITPVSTSTAAVSAWHDSATSSGFNGHCNLASTICHYIAKGQAA